MFTDFTATDRWAKKQVHCLYQALVVAIATRHADAVDIKFLVDGRPVWVALPHPAWVEYKKRTGEGDRPDSLAKEIAGHFLKLRWNRAKAWAAKCMRSPLMKLSSTWKAWWRRSASWFLPPASLEKKRTNRRGRRVPPAKSRSFASPPHRAKSGRAGGPGSLEDDKFGISQTEILPARF